MKNSSKRILFVIGINLILLTINTYNFSKNQIKNVEFRDITNLESLKRSGS
ncbi:MAG: hypothetical protein ACFFG0_09575 [Candidatus Thorarchaeota archaeon]